MWVSHKISDQELQGLVNQARRVFAERKLRYQGRYRYVLDSLLSDGVRYTKERKPCDNPKRKHCQE